MSIYGHLDLVGLVNISQTDTRNYSLAMVLFRQKYGQRRFIINGRSFHSEGKFIDRGYIDLVNIDFAMIVVKLFGPLMPRISINYNRFNSTGAKLINEFVHKYCANTLLHLELQNCHGAELRQLKGPFAQVQVVELASGNFFTEDIRFNQMFPALRRLEIHSVVLSDFAFIEQNMRHLEHLKFKPTRSMDVNDFTKMLQLNPQLKSISTDVISIDSLRMLSNASPMLDQLELWNLEKLAEHVGADIHIPQLKKLKYGYKFFNNQNNERIPIKCLTLEDVELEGSLGRWVDVIVQSKNMKKLKVDIITDDQLKRIAEELPNMQDIIVPNINKNSIESFIEFIATAKNLRSVSVNEITHDARKAIVGRFVSQWSVQGGPKSLILSKNY